MDVIRLSDSEWLLMNALWDHSPRTITQLVEQLREDTGWSKHTVITMLSRLEAKGAVRHEEGERAKQFYPILDRAATQRQETRSFLSRLYGGSLKLMVNTLVGDTRLSDEDLAALDALLKKAEEEQP
ncbi:BlaI/MecI/CopY family transcriptional regulator [Gemmiger formicilis]|uniref:BlaI/MecI/CopY family transcriptional regulator n=1 Tax=Gemmiger formicilis TaxID=745368 RepID=UPI001957217C|nr:BlaI/MecI/CopY family transcriptional regulator [Gemmiger formicilis]MBM6914310.1 BlaI/MecI/CopY family transcriptional regulator [Gemmiger formicilis]HIX33293.1 BlaI/MecI/CopY family transcriptional regulator [Candidatus Gemmiger avium]